MNWFNFTVEKFVDDNYLKNMLHSLPTHTPSPNTPYSAYMGYQNSPYLIDPSIDSTAVDFRAFYPYTPNEVKHRKRTTSAQLKVLETIFKKDTKPNANLRNELASELDMSARGVQVWFQNRRAKEKLKAGKSSKGPRSTSPTSSIDLSKQDLCPIKDEMIPPDSLIPTSDSPDNFDAYSQSSSPSTASPPQLHLITDPDNFCWNNSSLEPPDSTTSITHPNMFPGVNEFCSHRRGSLPANAFLAEPCSESQLDCSDPQFRRRSIDTSLQRLASNPFASLARAKNSALYGPGFGVSLPGRHHQLNHSPYGPPSQRRGMSQLAAMPQHASLRRLSMDSRSTRLSSRLNHSPSPSPLTPYGAVVRASLPDHLFPVISRTVVSPIPGPLPSPGFSFGAASTPSTTSPSSGDSERNSPDSLQSFTFRSEDNDEDGALSHYEVYSRFGSVASIATSESSINSSYFSELDHLATGDVRTEDRRSSCSAGQFLGLMSGLHVNGQIKHISNNFANYSPHEDYPYGRTSDDVELINSHEMHHHEQQQQTDGSYPSPTSTISPRGSLQSQDPSAPAVPISTSSELAFALENKPTDQTPGGRQESYMAYGDHHHQNHLSAAATTATSHAHAHVVDRNTTDHDAVDYEAQQHQHETDGTQSADATSVYQQETDCNALNSHGHYIASSYSSLSDAYLGSTDHQMNYTHCIGGGAASTFPPSVYDETLSSVLGHDASSLNGVIQPVETFASYST